MSPMAQNRTEEMRREERGGRIRYLNDLWKCRLRGQRRTHGHIAGRLRGKLERKKEISRQRRIFLEHDPTCCIGMNFYPYTAAGLLQSSDHRFTGLIGMRLLTYIWSYLSGGLMDRGCHLWLPRCSSISSRLFYPCIFNIHLYKLHFWVLTLRLLTFLIWLCLLFKVFLSYHVRQIKDRSAHGIDSTILSFAY